LSKKTLNSKLVVIRDWLIVKKINPLVMPDPIRHPVTENVEKELDSGSSPE
jgi:hypothetical protein